MINWPATYFKPEELLSPVGLREYEKGNLLLQMHFVRMLNEFRRVVDVPLLCNFGDMRLRGYRSPLENKEAGGVALSRHMQGIAADITPRGISVVELAEAASKFGFAAVGLYRDENFVHVDARAGTGGCVFWER